MKEKDKGTGQSMPEVMEEFSVKRGLTPEIISAILEKVARLDTASLPGRPGVSGRTLGLTHPF